LNDIMKRAILLPGVAQKPNGVLAQFPSVASTTIYEWCICCFLKAFYDRKFKTRAGLLARIVPAVFFLVWVFLATGMLPHGHYQWLLPVMLAIVLTMGNVKAHKCKVKANKSRFIDLQPEHSSKDC
jgi:hypothetical protein